MNDSYLSNPLLKRANVQIEYTPEQVQEYVRCSQDCDYFVTTYVKIVNVDRGLINFELRSYQKRMIAEFVANRFIITKMPRQSGKSTTVTSYILWKILFFNNQSCAILANKGRLANELLEKLKLSYENLPKWLQQGVLTWNKGNINLENGSSVLAAATSSSAVRGGSYNLILLDEFAHVARNIAEHFFASVYPTISSGLTTQMIIVSTPYGMNHYYKMWTDAIEARSFYKTIDVHWRDIPGRDDKWRDETIKNTSIEQWRQEFECEFLGSTNTLINPIKLRELVFVTPTIDKWGLEIYETPQQNRVYVVPVDTAHGVGQDYSAFIVVDVSVVPYRVVAKYRSNTVSPLLYPEIIQRYARWYNDAFVIPETNDIGQMVAETLHNDLEYENVLTTVLKGRAGQRVSSGFARAAELGVRMTKQVKRIGCSNLKDLIEDNKLLFQDFDIIEELSTFISTRDSFEAEEGHHDDLVMAMVIFGWLVRQPFFRDMTDQDIRARMAKEKYAEMIDDLIPAGFVDDGHYEEPQRIDRRSVSEEFMDLTDYDPNL